MKPHEEKVTEAIWVTKPIKEKLYRLKSSDDRYNEVIERLLENQK